MSTRDQITWIFQPFYAARPTEGAAESRLSRPDSATRGGSGTLSLLTNLDPAAPLSRRTDYSVWYGPATVTTGVVCSRTRRFCASILRVPRNDDGRLKPTAASKNHHIHNTRSALARGGAQHS